MTTQAQKDAAALVTDLRSGSYKTAERAFEGMSKLVGTMRSIAVPLTNAQIKALGTGPLVIVPAPGAGLILKLHSALVSVPGPANTDYTNIDSGAQVALGYAGGDDVTAYSPPDSGLTFENLLNNTAGGALALEMQTTQASSSAEENYTPTVNTAIDFRLYNGELTGPLTAGHANNALKVTALYTILEL